MKLTGNIYKLVLSLWTVAILWICIGTLVNFHQHKIWGKPLLPELLYAKRDKEKSIDLSKLLKPDLPKELKSFACDNVFFHSSYPSLELYQTSSSCCYKNTDELPSLRFILSFGLRAPPLS